MVVSELQPSTCWSEARTSTGSDGRRRLHWMWSTSPPRLILLHGFGLAVRSTRASFTPAIADARLSQIPRHAVRSATGVRK
jgi:hypothetical protein